ncbi:WGR domain-containing protein [Aeromonas salmonicida subsp. achromogenes]|nr:WGR domain-containing protein [Aeromonas salmonicida subsp. achromogenes]TMX17894.1 WGR domain-containing protein [Aeromonas salmonicida subsp. achromogenes]TMX18684.1 WGR domain-containing protein [Aeromonas salmonicida subsp. achromogenes]TMX21321.1 WGR domain-containing protein [Aeromonas salmonicida subsp. achromogenes]
MSPTSVDNLSDTRHYALLLQKDLFGDWTVVKVFGRKGTARGKILVKAFPGEHEATHYFHQECRRREQRGYQLISPTIKIR